MAGNRPFRWDLVRPDRLGSLLAGTAEPDLWFADELAVLAGTVLARCADGELYFLGRSPDSLFDLLSGALSGTSWRDRAHQLPLSMYGRAGADLTGPERDQLRANLADSGLDPTGLTHRRHPAVLVDLVASGSTFGNVFDELRGWLRAEGAQWDVARRKLRFLGITWRTETSPSTWRWQQHVDWADELPAGALRSVSLAGDVWHYLGNVQVKTAPSFTRRSWSDATVARPRHDEATRQALAEAVALVGYGASEQARRRIRQTLRTEPTMPAPWLKALDAELGRPAGR